jgi:DNA-binding protein YbaB
MRYMFENLKQLGKLKELRDILEKERKEVEKEGTRVVVNGKMEVEEITLNPQLEAKKQEEVLRNCINEAVNQIRQEAAKKMFNV